VLPINQVEKKKQRQIHTQAKIPYLPLSCVPFKRRKACLKPDEEQKKKKSRENQATKKRKNKRVFSRHTSAQSQESSCPHVVNEQFSSAP
jgi:hypothetical protein